MSDHPGAQAGHAKHCIQIKKGNDLVKIVQTLRRAEQAWSIVETIASTI